MTTAGVFPAAGCEGVAAVTWTIAAIAQMTGVTSRTLRHDGEACCRRRARRPTATASTRRGGGLQEVLLLRELGLGLEVIAQVLDGRRDRVEALRRHEQHLRGRPSGWAASPTPSRTPSST